MTILKQQIKMFWSRVPTIVKAFLSALAVALAGTVPWAVLANANLRHMTSVPWSVPLAALYMWLFWRYVRGGGWPRSTAAMRRTTCRANQLPATVWGAALSAGTLGLAAIVVLMRLMSRLVSLPAQSQDDLTSIPTVTLAGLVLTGALVAGLAEESAFRGYFQRPIERRHGPAIAILLTGCVFGLAHLTHIEVTMVLMPYYMAVAAVYGLLAYFTDSILPSVVLHSVGNVLGSIDLLVGGRSEWQTSPAGPAGQRLIWVTGTDPAFWRGTALFFVVAAGAVFAYRMLATIAKTQTPEKSPVVTSTSVE